MVRCFFSCSCWAYMPPNVSKRKRAVSPFSRWFNQFRSDFFRSLFLHLLEILFGNLFVCFLVHYLLRSINMLAGEMFNDCNRKSCSNFQTSAVIRITRCIMCAYVCCFFRLYDPRDKRSSNLLESKEYYYRVRAHCVCRR